MECRVVSCQRDASHYGKCEVCKNSCNQFFKQQKRKSINSKGWITSLFGHESCLKYGNYETA